MNWRYLDVGLGEEKIMGDFVGAEYRCALHWGEPGTLSPHWREGGSPSKSLESPSQAVIHCMHSWYWYDTVSDPVVKPFPRRSEIQYQYIWVIRVGDDCHDGSEWHLSRFATKNSTKGLKLPTSVFSVGYVRSSVLKTPKTWNTREIKT